MWPWSQQPDITELLSSEEEEEGGEDDDDHTDPNAAGGGLRPLVLRAPGGGNGSRRAGAYSVAANFVVEGELLEKAISRVTWLTVSFRRQESSAFPLWIFQLENLRGLSLQSYPHATLPDQIGDLDQLERFHCCGSALTRLPRSMGRLQNLVELDCYTSYGLHYLPYEFTKCPNLVSSRFSTRALYANYKNDLALPPLQPWWQGHFGAPIQSTTPAATTPDSVSQAMAQVCLDDSVSSGQQMFPPSFTEQHILPLLAWDSCSVCGQTYELGLGYYAWSRQTIATDRQALLAFCCSTQCAASIPNQMHFDPASRTNRGGPDMTSRILPLFTLEEAVRAYGKANHPKKAPEYTKWTKEHLGVGWVPRRSVSEGPLTIMKQLSWNDKFHLRPHGRFMKVIASGDIRGRPSSRSQNLDRLWVGSIVCVDEIHRDPNTKRQWARLRLFHSNNSDDEDDDVNQQNAYWTALAKKDGTQKLAEIKILSSKSSTTPSS